MNAKKIIAIVVIAILIMPAFLGIEEESATDDKIIVYDGQGTKFEFDEPVNKVVTVGLGISSTVAGVGCTDKIVVCDKYSNSESESVLKELVQKIKDGKVTAGGDMYSDSGFSQLKTEILDATGEGEGKFDIEKDVILMYSPSSSAYIERINELKSFGYKIMWWDKAGDYDVVIDLIETISKVCTGGITKEASEVRTLHDYVENTVEEKVKTKVDAFYITYSGNAFKVGNYGSLATSEIVSAGGNVVTFKEGGSTTYQVSLTEITEIVEAHPGVKIFADNSITSSEEHYSELKKAVGDAKIYALKANANNFSIQSAQDGLWFIASSLYPDLFPGEDPEKPSSSDNTIYYIVAAVIVIAIIGLAGYYVVKR